MKRSFSWLVLCALVTSLLAVSAGAQSQTGNIYGNVKAPDGSVLPGVTITLTGVGAPQVFYTDGQGNFRFINLSPGTYTVAGELEGYGKVVREHITVNVGRNADVALYLRAAVQEVII